MGGDFHEVAAMKVSYLLVLGALVLGGLFALDRNAQAGDISNRPVPPMRVNGSPPAPRQCTTITLNGSVETVFTGVLDSRYRISTNGKDIYYFEEPASAFDGGTADATQARLPDPGVEVVTLDTSTKLHFFASAATTATICQTGP